jgi:hypothetical protein
MDRHSQRRRARDTRAELAYAPRERLVRRDDRDRPRAPLARDELDDPIERVRANVREEHLHAVAERAVGQERLGRAAEDDCGANAVEARDAREPRE